MINPQVKIKILENNKLCQAGKITILPKEERYVDTSAISQDGILRITYTDKEFEITKDGWEYADDYRIIQGKSSKMFVHKECLF